MTDFLDFLERPGCHLCEEALPVAQRLARRLGVPLQRTDIEGDDALISEFGLRIPVLRLRSRVVAEGIVEFRPALAAARHVLEGG